MHTKPRVSPTLVVNHSSLRSGHPSTTGTLLVLNLPLDECIDNTQREMKFRERKKGRRKKNKEAQLMTKTTERQRKVTS
jgi:hypothetical protein